MVKGPKSGDALVLSKDDARLATTVISTLDGQDHDYLMDILSSEDYLSDLRSNKGAEKPTKDERHGSVMNSMVKNIVAQRLAGDYANEEGIARLVSELEDPSTAPERRNAAVQSFAELRMAKRKVQVQERDAGNAEGENTAETMFQKLKQLCNRRKLLSTLLT